MIPIIEKINPNAILRPTAFSTSYQNRKFRARVSNKTMIARNPGFK